MKRLCFSLILLTIGFCFGQTTETSVSDTLVFNAFILKTDPKFGDYVTVDLVYKVKICSNYVEHIGCVGLISVSYYDKNWVNLRPVNVEGMLKNTVFKIYDQ